MNLAHVISSFKTFVGWMDKSPASFCNDTCIVSLPLSLEMPNRCSNTLLVTVPSFDERRGEFETSFSLIVTVICAGLRYPIFILSIRSSQYSPSLKSVCSKSNGELDHKVFGTTTGISFVVSKVCIFEIYFRISSLISSRFFQLNILCNNCSLDLLISSGEYRQTVGIGLFSLNPAI